MKKMKTGITCFEKRENCVEKNEKSKDEKGKEHVFKSDIQGKISNRQLLISDCKRLSGNVCKGIHSHNHSCMYREQIFRKSIKGIGNTLK